MIKAVLFDFTGVIADIRPALIGEEGPDWKVEPIVPIVDAIPELRKTGLKTCLVSNNDRQALIAGATNIDFDALFEVLVFSSDIGYNKPHPRIYTYAIEQLGVEADECLFVDDLARNVDAATAVGMQGVVADSPATVVEMLAKLA